VTWTRIDDTITTSAKAVDAGDYALGAWVRLLAWCNKEQTNGFITKRRLRALRVRPKQITRLIESRLLHEPGDQDARVSDDPEKQKAAMEWLVGPGKAQTGFQLGSNWVPTGFQLGSSWNGLGIPVYVLHDFLDYNRSSWEIEQKRELDRKRKHEARENVRAESERSPTTPVPDPVPDPLRDERLANPENAARHEWAKVEHAMASKVKGGHGGKGAMRVLALCPLTDLELESALRSSGESYAYLAKVIESIRSDDAERRRLGVLAPVSKKFAPEPPRSAKWVEYKPEEEETP